MPKSTMYPSLCNFSLYWKSDSEQSQNRPCAPAYAILVFIEKVNKAKIDHVPQLMQF